MATNGKVKKNNTTRTGGQKTDASPYVGSMVGALVGAAVGAVAARAMSDKKTRGKVTDLMQHAFDVLKDINDEPRGAQKLVGEVIQDVTDTATRKLLRKNK